MKLTEDHVVLWLSPFLIFIYSPATPSPCFCNCYWSWVWLGFRFCCWVPFFFFFFFLGSWCSAYYYTGTYYPVYTHRLKCCAIRRVFVVLRTTTSPAPLLSQLTTRRTNSFFIPSTPKVLNLACARSVRTLTASSVAAKNGTHRVTCLGSAPSRDDRFLAGHLFN